MTWHGWAEHRASLIAALDGGARANGRLRAVVIGRKIQSTLLHTSHCLPVRLCACRADLGPTASHTAQLRTHGPPRPPASSSRLSHPLSHPAPAPASAQPTHPMCERHAVLSHRPRAVMHASAPRLRRVITRCAASCAMPAQCYHTERGIRRCVRTVITRNEALRAAARRARPCHRT